jgi:diamine N-acetyltransferase
MIIIVRKAKEEDVLDVFNLSNLSSTRKYSINQNRVLWEDHLIWYKEVLKSEKVVLYIITDEKNFFLGQVRYTIYNKSAQISISIVDELKGKGYGLSILEKTQKLIVNEKGINKIIARINSKNEPSIKLFKRAGYKLVGVESNFLEFVLEI